MNTHQTSHHQVECPGTIEFDNRGKRIVPGITVAYNMSGTVQRGILKEITKNGWTIARQGVGDKKWWSLKFEAIIWNEDGITTSKIRNVNSFIII